MSTLTALLETTRAAVIRLAERGGLLARLMNHRGFRRALGPRGCGEAWRRLGARIDPSAKIGTWVWIRCPPNVTVGPESSILSGELDAWAPITIGRRVLINSAKLYSAQHDLDSPDLAGQNLPIAVGDYAWLIHDVVVMPGITIGRAAVVATRSVVTRDVDEYSVVAGNPAREIRKRARTDFTYVPAGPDWG